jgi:RES domain-containing protein
MRLFRISGTRFISDLSGTGGLFASGRWHEKGTRILYTAESLALAKLEVLANSLLTPEDQSTAIMEVPDDVAVKEITLADLPKDWDRYPAPKELPAITEAWIKENKYLLLKVPSAQSEFDFNYLVNPNHPDHNRLKIIQIITPQKFDKRLKGETRKTGKAK